MRTIALFAALMSLVGCHAKFKREVGNIDDVQLQIITQSGPNAQLGQVYAVVDPDPETEEEAAANAVAAVAAGVINVVQAVKEEEVRRKLADAVDIEATNSAMLQGVADTLGGGPPFSVAGSGASDNLLQLEVMSWGLSVPNIGAQGTFTYQVRARVYKADGDRIYSSRMTCEIAAGTPGAGSVALGLVNNVKQIKKMSNEELQTSFSAMAEYCGSVFVAKMRRHAG
ncbi:MAG: hypothetical protein KTR31_19705 [Myxococcales bacterium]|nr:hypothetical protein [Myxococcales bacterium]